MFKGKKKSNILVFVGDKIEGCLAYATQDNSFLHYTINNQKGFALITVDPIRFTDLNNNEYKLYFITETDMNTFRSADQSTMLDGYVSKYLTFFEQNPTFVRHTYTNFSNENLRHVLTEDMIFSFLDNHVIRNLFRSLIESKGSFILHCSLGALATFVFLVIISVLAPDVATISFGGKT